MKIRIATFISMASVIAATLAPSTALAAGTSTYSLQTNGNTISIYETSSVAVNTVEADVAYTGLGSIKAVGVTIGSTFTTCISQTSASIVCTALGGSITGTHLVATLSFTVNDPTTDAAVTASITDSSMILASSDSSETLNHAALPSATYHYTAPAPQPKPKKTPSPTTTTKHTVAPKSTVTTNRHQPTPATKGKTLADTHNKSSISVDRTAATVPGLNWTNLVVIFALVTALTACTGAAARWLMNHRIRLVVTDAGKKSAKESSKPAGTAPRAPVHPGAKQAKRPTSLRKKA